VRQDEIRDPEACDDQAHDPEPAGRLLQEIGWKLGGCGQLGARSWELGASRELGTGSQDLGIEGHGMLKGYGSFRLAGRR
jgi:hypothetical protein